MLCHAEHRAEQGGHLAYGDGRMRPQADIFERLLSRSALQTWRADASNSEACFNACVCSRYRCDWGHLFHLWHWTSKWHEDLVCATDILALRVSCSDSYGNHLRFAPHVYFFEAPSSALVAIRNGWIRLRDTILDRTLSTVLSSPLGGI
jgi:hypothetical protein